MSKQGDNTFRYCILIMIDQKYQESDVSFYSEQVQKTAFNLLSSLQGNSKNYKIGIWYIDTEL